MAVRQARYSREQFARRGQDIYDRVVRPLLQPHDENKFVVIDIESADYELDADGYTATERLLNWHSDAQIWLSRVGQPATYRIGLLGGRE